MNLQTKQNEIAKYVVELTMDSMCQIDMEISEDSARRLVQTISNEMDSKAVMANNAKFVALQVVMYIAQNAKENNEYNALCMLALSVAWGASGYTAERSLTLEEAKFLDELKCDAIRLVVDNKLNVDNPVAVNFIGASILSLCFEDPLSVS